METYNPEFMKQAITLARENIKSGKGGPFGAVVVKDNKVIATAMNEVTSTDDPTAHAELVAIRRACKALNTYQLEGCEIYSSCEPCPMCLGAIYWARINMLHYAGTKDDAAKADFDDSVIYKEFCLPKEKRFIPSSQLMRDDAVKIFEEWIKNENKIPY